MALLLAVLLPAAAAHGAGIEAVGVVGNSGVAGPSLVRTLEGTPSGVAAGRDLVLWTGGGDAVNRLSLDGRLLDRFPLEPPGSRITGGTFVVLADTLYFFGDVPGKGAALFALPMRPGGAAAPVALALPQAEGAYVLAARPLSGRLVLGARLKGEKEKPLGVFCVDPAAATVTPSVRLDGHALSGIAVDDARKVFYCGSGVISAFHEDGKPVDGFPVPCMKTPAIPTAFTGRLSLAGGALWDAAWYGFLSRHDLRGDGDPGRVIEWSNDLDYPTQVLGLREGSDGADPLLVTCAESDAFYFAVWRRGPRDFVLLRRLGCLPRIASVGLSRDGWVAVGTSRTELLWRWDDPPDAVPRRADIHMAVTPAYFTRDGVFALGGQYHLKEQVNREGYVPTFFPLRTGDRNEAARGERPPFKTPVGLSVQVRPGDRTAGLFVSDAATRQVWRTATTADRPMEIRTKEWRPIEIAGETLQAPTDLAALADGRILLADGGRVLLLEPQGEAWRVAWQMDRWGDGPGDRFGPHLRLAVDGAWMLVSDTDRHRLVWIDWAERKVLGEFGQADAAGDDLRHLAGPAQVALQGDRALVADAGNQRVLKLVLRP